jgi:Ni,Fe-hydrogenase I large subunit
MLILTWNGQSIEQRDTDGMVNLTQMAQANSTNVANWSRLDVTTGYIRQLASSMQICIDDIFVTKPGSPENGGGTWAHYLLAIEFGRWISPAFAIWCDRHIHRLVTTGSTSIKSNREHLEKSAVERPTMKQIEQAGKVYGRLYGKAYEQQYIRSIRNA